MTSPILLNLFDFFLLAAILLFAFEALRVTMFKAEPLCAVAFALMSIGSFGWAINDLYGVFVPPYAVFLHAGLAAHVGLLYRKQRRLALRSTDNPHISPLSIAIQRRELRERMTSIQRISPTVPASRGAANPPPKTP